jgi:hypothetical protein
MGTIEERLRALEDERAILRTLYTYGYAIDYGRPDDYADCFLDDATLHWPFRGGPLVGLERIMEEFHRHTHGPDTWHKHFVVDPLITIEGDRAAAESMYARIDSYETGPEITVYGRYRDVLVRCEDGRWRISERHADPECRRFDELVPARITKD